MGRDMRAAQRELFDRFDLSCELAGRPMPEAGRTRFVSADSGLARDRLKRLVCRSVQRFTPHTSLLYLDSEDTGRFLVSLGLRDESMNTLEGYPRAAVDSGLFQVAILESKVMPSAGPDLIRDAVAWGSMDDIGYSGHPAVQLMELFPAIAAVELPSALSLEEVATLFWKVVVGHCEHGPSWIGSVLAEDLRSLGQVAVPGLPYGELCWAALSHDPRSLFLALYRCLEAAYAYDVASKLNAELGLTCTWQHTAQALGTYAGWRPQEERSLVKLLAKADSTDVESLAILLGSKKDDAWEGAGASIYQLRNGIVHYRPELKLVEIDRYDWQAVCATMSRIVVSVLSIVHRVK